MKHQKRNPEQMKRRMNPYLKGFLIFALIIVIAYLINRIASQAQCLEKADVCYKITTDFWGRHYNEVDCESPNWDVKKEECISWIP